MTNADGTGAITDVRDVRAAITDLWAVRLEELAREILADEARLDDQPLDVVETAEAAS